MTSAKLKTIAIVSMTIDHLAGTILWKRLCPILIHFLSSIGFQISQMHLYLAFRSVGRIAFPIFAFLIVEGCRHTKDPKKYLIRLFLFACISELPFDYAISGRINIFSQNVFFTLFLGACMIICFEKPGCSDLFRIAFHASIFVLFAIIATILHTDYSYMGIGMIAIFYFFAMMKPAYYIMAFFQGIRWYYILPIALSISLILLYNGKRGKQFKWFFYVFYPCHLLLFYILAAI